MQAFPTTVSHTMSTENLRLLLPSSAEKYDLDPTEYVRAMDAAVAVLARTGPTLPQEDWLSILETTGISPDHPLFSDTQMLYEEALRYAFARLWPAHSTVLEHDVVKLVPVDAIRRLVSDMFGRFRSHPDCARLIVRENVTGSAEVAKRIDVLEPSPVILQLDRVLMRGHDLGAFRTGVSAEDVYLLITALCQFPASQGSTFHVLYGMDVNTADNTAGLEKLACDAVVAFLTTPMRTTQGNSYTHPSEELDGLVGDSVASSLYDEDDFH